MTKKLKDFIKQNVAPASKFGTNPTDPWSAKANLSEGKLETYLKSRGINPEYVSRDQKIAHAKSNAFKSWLQNHQNEEVELPENTGHLVQSPTKKRLSDLRQRLSSHKEISVTHDQPVRKEAVAYGNENEEFEEEEFEETEDGEEVEEVEELDEKLKDAYHTSVENGVFKQAHGKNYLHDKDLKSYGTNDKLTDEPRIATFDKESHAKKAAKQHGGTVAKMSLGTYRVVKEDKYQDPQAATQTVGMEVESKKKLKSFKKMSEELSSDTYGKKPKMEKAEKEDSFGENKPQAVGVMSGGTTLTGEKRDTVEIDPMLRSRPGQPDVDKKDVKKQEAN